MSNTIKSAELANAVHVIKDAVLRSQQRALYTINQELLALYYGIGRFVSVNTRNKNWGSGFIETLSEQIRKELPGLRGFSATNLRNMRTFYEEWKALENNISSVQTDKNVSFTNSSVRTDELNQSISNTGLTNNNEIYLLQRINIPDFPTVAFLGISFTHHVAILTNAKTYEQRKFYIQYASDFKVKVDDLVDLIKNDLHKHQGGLANNFKKTIPNQLQAYRTITMFKDEYLLDFINAEELFIRDKDRDERIIEKNIIQNVKEFIMTFGKDFTFIGNQYRLEKYGIEEFPDLLFFNRELAAIVCVELKNGPFKPSYLGQLAAYLRILDDEIRKPNENPSIGIILCKSANKKFVEYVIQDYDKPIGVATYRTTADMDEKLKKLLPSVEDLEKLF